MTSGSSRYSLRETGQKFIERREVSGAIFNERRVPATRHGYQRALLQNLNRRLANVRRHDAIKLTDVKNAAIELNTFFNVPEGAEILIINGVIDLNP